jgi:peptide/nickel transport system ATP-binding protein
MILTSPSTREDGNDSWKVPLISFRNFGVDFKTFDGTLTALEEVDLDIHRGETVGIIGESGCGKTTLVTAIMGLVADNGVVKGEVRLKGEVVADPQKSGINYRKLRRRERKMLDEKLINLRWKDASIVFQGSMNAFNPAYTIEKQISEVFKIHTKFSKDEIREKSIRVLEEAGLNKSVLKAFPHELSGGMKQRAVLAMALALSPSVIIADEPTTGLDVVIQAKIIQELKRIKRESNKAMIVVSHDIGVVSQLAERVAVLYAGRIMEIGNTWDVYQRPLNPYTLALMRSYPSLERSRKRMEGIPGSTPPPYAERKGCLFADRCAFADKRCTDEKPELREIEPGRFTRCHYPERLRGLSVESQGGDEILSSSTIDEEDVIVKLEHIREYFSLRASAGGALFSRELGSKYVRAVDDLSINIRRGEIFGVIGESGSGKTTLARVIIKLIDATSGRVAYFHRGPHGYRSRNLEVSISGEGRASKNGRKEADSAEKIPSPIEISSTKEKDKAIRAFRRFSQLIFQDPYDSIDPKMSVYDVVNEPIIAHKITKDPLKTRDMIARALSTVHLTPPENFFERFSHELSGGERQRVTAARALVLGPEFIIMDEPISMLDVSLRAGFMNLILEMRRDLELSVLYITHDLASARYVCDRLLVMYLGVGVETGNTEDVVKNPAHPYTKALLKAVPKPTPDWDPEAVEIIGEIGNAIDVPKGCRFFKRCIYAQSICKDTPPPKMEVGKDHWYLCHFSQEELSRIHEGLARKN